MGKMLNPEDYIGKKYGRLTVKELSREQVGNAILWVAKCDCDCGNQHDAVLSKLKYSHVKSCGCLQRETISGLNTTHGGCHTRLHSIWSSMKQRCLNPNAKNYCNYGGRGVTICDEWLTFAPFREWALSSGYGDHLSIDRINNDNGYSPDNCRWATRITQNRNRRVNTSSGTGVRGVQKHRDKWKATITCSKNTIFLGSFDTISEAALARKQAEDKYW